MFPSRGRPRWSSISVAGVEAVAVVQHYVVVALAVLVGWNIPKPGTVCSTVSRLTGLRAGLLLFILTSLRANIQAIGSPTSVDKCVTGPIQLSNMKKAEIHGCRLLRSVTLPVTVVTVSL